MFFRDLCAGVDEVGRGPLAGAVVAAAVILDPFAAIDGLRDSKALSHKRRKVLDEEIKSRAIAWCIARADVAEIDRINILQASLVAMQRAVAGLGLSPANGQPSLNTPAKAQPQAALKDSSPDKPARFTVTDSPPAPSPLSMAEQAFRRVNA